MGTIYITYGRYKEAYVFTTMEIPGFRLVKSPFFSYYMTTDLELAEKTAKDMKMHIHRCNYGEVPFPRR